MLVALIDDWLQVEYLPPNQKVSLYIVADGNIKKHKKTYATSTLSHSTLCSKLLLTAAVDIFHIQIFNDMSNASVDDLIIALKLCIERRVNIINLSIGTTRLSDYIKLYPILEELNRKNILVIAAQSNAGKVTIPACLPYTIGVATVKRECKVIKQVEKNHWGINLIVPVEKYATSLTKKATMFEGNSFAAPIVTSELCEYAKDNADLSGTKLRSAFLEQYPLLTEEYFNCVYRKKEVNTCIVPYVYLETTECCSHIFITEMMSVFRNKYNVETICITNKEEKDPRFFQIDTRWIDDDICNNFYCNTDLLLIENCVELNCKLKEKIDVFVSKIGERTILLGGMKKIVVERIDNISEICDQVISLLT